MSPRTAPVPWLVFGCTTMWNESFAMVTSVVASSGSHPHSRSERYSNVYILVIRPEHHRNTRTYRSDVRLPNSRFPSAACSSGGPWSADCSWPAKAVSVPSAWARRHGSHGHRMKICRTSTERVRRTKLIKVETENAQFHERNKR